MPSERSRIISSAFDVTVMLILVCSSPRISSGASNAMPTKERAITRACVSSFAKNAVGEIFNAGSGSDISINKLAAVIEEDKKKILHVAHHHPQAEIKRLRCNYSKAKKLLGWSPKISLEKGIEKTKEWLAKEVGD